MARIALVLSFFRSLVAAAIVGIGSFRGSGSDYQRLRCGLDSHIWRRPRLHPFANLRRSIPQMAV
jgi:hypothetical protein